MENNLDTQKEFHPQDDATSYPGVIPENERGAGDTPAELEGGADEPEQKIKSSIEKPVREMTDAEIEEYYRDNSLEKRSHTSMSDYMLDVVQRYGAIVSSRRQRAEIDGENATITKVRRIVQTHVDQYGTAQFLVERLASNNAKLGREDPGPEIKVTVHCEGVDITMGFADIQAAYGQRQNSQTMEFNRKVNDMLNLIKIVANQAKGRACKVDGKNYEGMCHDITWKNVLSNLNQEYNSDAE